LHNAPLRLLADNQVRPFLFYKKQDLVTWVNEGGLQQPCTGAPALVAQYVRPELPFDPSSPASYKKHSSPSAGAVDSVIQASHRLYSLNSIVDIGEQAHTLRILNRFAPIKDHTRISIAVSAAYIAYIILHASPRQVRSIIPVRIIARSAGNPRLSEIDITNAWVLLLGICADKDNHAGDQDRDDTSNITFSLLPLRLDMYGSRQVDPKRRESRRLPHSVLVQAQRRYCEV
jgi:hypothetical protein